MQSPLNNYQHNIQQYRLAAAKLAERLKMLSFSRIAAFVASIIFIVIFANARMVALLFFVVPLAVLAFVVLLKRYNKAAYQKQHAVFLKEINEQEVLRLENKLSSFPAGEAYRSPHHPYVADLDIFRSHSLFQLINRTTTESGSVCLAAWMSASAPKPEILNRQQAVKELAPLLDWRQDFQASGMHHSNAKSDYNKLLAWLEKPVQLLPNKTKYLAAGISLALLTSLALLYHFIYAYTSDYLLNTLPLLLMLIVNYIVLKRLKPVAEEIIDDTHQNIKILGGYQSLIRKIEGEQFKAPLLLQLQSVFSQQNYSAAAQINKLKNILEVSQLKGTKRNFGNQFYTILNMFWLLDIYWIIQTEQWKVRNSSYLRSWAAAVSEFEALSSMAGFAYSNPSYTFPEIKTGPCTIDFEMLGHPLLKPEGRRSNDFSLRARENIAMITGSNMAGKSTFLRTVGANLVLALMGAPCCAKWGEVSELKIFTSMRTQDNLEEGISSFYAELKKVEQLLQLVQSGEAIFFMLDEMFKGTNSKDRHRGGFSLIKQLEELNAFGIISTHDLDLADLAGKHRLVKNYSFNSEIRQGEMIFDYKLTPGLCKDFNASELMKKSGIKVLDYIEEG
ncbi:DNA mismatch repair protein MutS [Cesiribacter sp. SM1]|uniref:MutS-related protein n=1 Tax=Cesiribacter sp. SM1 TaxID=2861196 RepID=UPI001CD59394|nr:DNA mismatch repair protein MutS [Cesiribacter sp. SM1]